MSLPFFTIARAGFNLYEVGSATGVIGWPDVAQALARIVPKMLAKAHKVDSDSLDEMVSLAKSRVPVDTGRLLNGIAGEIVDDGCEFRASAVRALSTGKLSADYARFVEYGHQTRTLANPAVADDIFYGAASSPLKSRTARGAEIAPQPFFYNSVDDVLERRGLAMQDVIAGTAAEDGWQTA